MGECCNEAISKNLPRLLKPQVHRARTLQPKVTIYSRKHGSFSGYLLGHHFPNVFLPRDIVTHIFKLAPMSQNSIMTWSAFLCILLDLYIRIFHKQFHQPLWIWVISKMLNKLLNLWWPTVDSWLSFYGYAKIIYWRRSLFITSCKTAGLPES